MGGLCLCVCVNGRTTEYLTLCVSVCLSACVCVSVCAGEEWQEGLFPEELGQEAGGP